MAVIRLVLYFILFLIVIRLARLIIRYWFSSKRTVDDLRQEHKSANQKFKDAEEAEFREIKFKDPEEKEDKQDY